MKSSFRSSTLILLLFVISACRAEPSSVALQFPKETEGVNHEAKYRIVVKGSVISVNGLEIEAKKRTVKNLSVLNNGNPLKKGFLWPDYYNNYGVSFFAVPYKDGLTGDEWSEAEYQQWPIVAVNVYLQQTERLERHTCSTSEYKEKLYNIDKSNNELDSIQSPGKRLKRISKNECEASDYVPRPTHTYAGYLEVDGLPLPVGRKISYAEIQERRQTLGLPPLEGHHMDGGGTIFHGYAKNRNDGVQTWTFAIPNGVHSDPDGTQRYLEHICVGDCP
jgi:hypothetical protein